MVWIRLMVKWQAFLKSAGISFSLLSRFLICNCQFWIVVNPRKSYENLEYIISILSIWVVLGSQLDTGICIRLELKFTNFTYKFQVGASKCCIDVGDGCKNFRSFIFVNIKQNLEEFQYNFCNRGLCESYVVQIMWMSMKIILRYVNFELFTGFKNLSYLKLDIQSLAVSSFFLMPNLCFWRHLQHFNIRFDI